MKHLFAAAAAGVAATTAAAAAPAASAPPPTPWIKPKGGGACTSNFDCHLAGECDQHRTRTCFCDAAWTGKHCEFLAVRPGRGALALRQKHASSWGGRPVASDAEGPEPAQTEVDGFFGVLGDSCGLNLRNNVSYIAHTTSVAKEGAGAQVVADVAVPVLATCVDHVKVNGTDGVERYILFHNGDGQPRACDVGGPNCSSLPLEWVADCSGPGTAANGTTPDANVTARPPGFPPVGFIPSNGVHVAPSATGPWSPPSPGAVEGFPFCDCPAVHALRNGSIAVWCQGIEFNFQPGHNASATVPPLYINQGWGTAFEEREVVVNLPYPYAKIAAEHKQKIRLDDPTLWVDQRGYWHALMHNGGPGNFPCGDNSAYGRVFRDSNTFPVGCAAHLYSEDGLNWTMSTVAAHNATVSMAGGTDMALILKRPKVRVRPAVGGLGHIITALFHGATQCGDQPIVANATAPYSYCTVAAGPVPLAFTDGGGAGSGGGGGDGASGGSGGNGQWPGEPGAQTFDNLDYGFTVALPLYLPENFPPPP